MRETLQRTFCRQVTNIILNVVITFCKQADVVTEPVNDLEYYI